MYKIYLSLILTMLVIIACKKQLVPKVNEPKSEKWVINLEGTKLYEYPDSTSEVKDFLSFGSKIEILAQSRTISNAYSGNLLKKQIWYKTCNYKCGVYFWINEDNFSSYETLNEIILKEAVPQKKFYMNKNFDPQNKLQEIWVYAGPHHEPMQIFLFSENLMIMHSNEDISSFFFYDYEFEKNKAFINVYDKDLRLDFKANLLPDIKKEYIDIVKKRIKYEIKYDELDKDYHFDFLGWYFIRQ